MTVAELVLLSGLSRAHIVDHTCVVLKVDAVVTRCGRIGLRAVDQSAVGVASKCRRCEAT